MGLKATDAVLASGTGFVYEHEGGFYLVTNWHNVTGRDPITGRCFLESLAVPDTAVTQFRDKSQVGKVHWEHLKLYRDDSLMEPSWFEHPSHGRKVDVVVLPLDA